MEWKIEIEGERFVLEEGGAEVIQFRFLRDLNVKKVEMVAIEVPENPSPEKVDFYRERLLSLFFREVRFKYNFEEVFSNLQQLFQNRLEELKEEYNRYIHTEEELKELLLQELRENDDNMVGFGIVKRWEIREVLEREEKGGLDRKWLQRVVNFLKLVYQVGERFKGALQTEVVEIEENFYFYSPINNRIGILMVTQGSRLGIYLKTMEKIVTLYNTRIQQLKESGKEEG